MGSEMCIRDRYGLGDPDTGGTKFTVTDKFSTGTQSTTGWTGLTGTDPYQLGKTYVVFSGLTPTTSGSLSGEFTNAVSGQFAGINGFQLVAVPEPEMLAGLGVIGSCLAAVIRRRLQPGVKSAS